MVNYVVMAIVAYLIGSINFGVIIGKHFSGVDVREEGSKSSGATNVLRTVGKEAAIATLVCDALKGVASVLIALLAGVIAKKSTDPAILVQIAALFVVLGHTFPVFFNFRGGKGVATSLGVMLLLNWQIAFICLTFALILMGLTRMVSLGSVSGAILFAVLTLFIRENYLVEGNYILFGIFLAGLVIFNHRANIKRIMDGNENRLNFSKKEKEGEDE